MEPVPSPSPDFEFPWDALGHFKAAGGFLAGYPDETRVFFSPRDQVHPVLSLLLRSCHHSLVMNMYGYDDDELDSIIRDKMNNDHVYVQISLDSSQASGVHEKALLKNWPTDAFGTSIAVGQSVKHAISHLKVAIVDGVYTVRGSTNWSLSGEGKQDNEMILTRNATLAAELRAVLDINHTEMLKQMAAKQTLAPPSTP